VLDSTQVPVATGGGTAGGGGSGGDGGGGEEGEDDEEEEEEEEDDDDDEEGGGGDGHGTIAYAWKYTSSWTGQVPLEHPQAFRWTTAGWLTER
jgi:hypothetical protein